MEAIMLNQKWQEAGKIELNKSVFWVKVNEDLIHRSLVYQLANARINLAHGKTRGERRGSTRKIYKQKGTGRARMGSNRSPIRKKGWLAFGPRNNRNFTISMNKKERRFALYSILTSKLKNKELIILDDIKLKEIKTKGMVDVFNKVPYEKNVLLAIPQTNEVIEKSASNIPYVKSILVSYLNTHDLLKYKTLVLMKGSVDYLNALAK